MVYNAYLVEFRKSQQPNKATVVWASSINDAVQQVEAIKIVSELSDYFTEITRLYFGEVVTLKDRLI